MKNSRLSSLFSLSIRFAVSGLALITGLFQGQSLIGFDKLNKSTLFATTVVAQNCDSGGDERDEDYCQGTYACTYFCPCGGCNGDPNTQCGDPTGGGCYYGWGTYWEGCGGGGGPY